jgi:hypothetical protein
MPIGTSLAAPPWFLFYLWMDAENPTAPEEGAKPQDRKNLGV